MLLSTKSTIVIALTFYLLGCQPKNDNVALAQLQAAQAKGDLAAQLSTLDQLLKVATPTQLDQYKVQIKTIEQVTLLNTQSQALLAEQPLQALELAIKADELVYNQVSRKIIKSVLSPYLDFVSLHTQLRNWASIPFERMVAVGTIPPNGHRWLQAMDKPQLWPDTNLMNLMQASPRNFLRYFRPIVTEREQMAELVRLCTRLHNSVPNDPLLQILSDDAKAINAMYSTILMDFLGYYVEQGLQRLIDANISLDKVARDAVIDKIDNEQWLIDRKITTDVDKDTIKWNSLYYINKIGSLFPFVEAPNTYHQRVLDLSKSLKALADKNFEKQPTASQTLVFTQQQNKMLQQHLTQLTTLATDQNRKKIAADYFRVTYAWQNNDFAGLEALLPHLRNYRASIRGY